MSDKQSVEDLAEKIMGVAIRTGKGISTVNAEEQILELLQSWQSTSVMKEKRREELLERLNYWRRECRSWIEHHGYSCDDGCPSQDECEQDYEEFKALLQKPEIDKDWLPTPKNINALPEPVRKFIHDIETNCDPAHIVRENVLIKDTCKMLVLKLEEKKKKEKGK